MVYNGFEYQIKLVQKEKLLFYRVYVATYFYPHLFNVKSFLKLRLSMLKKKSRNVVDIYYSSFIKDDVLFISSLELKLNNHANFIYSFDIKSTRKDNMMDKIEELIKYLIDNVEVKQIKPLEEKYLRLSDILSEEDINKKINAVTSVLPITKKALVEHLGYTENFLYQSSAKEKYSDKFIKALNGYIELEKIKHKY
ncbi:hypothetical protein [Campylobacter sp. RM12651]|uniref:hypothetical protein n=1 Tax=Campylobacter sp. RM12651 TaxID=1660079 RepID=UPI001EFBF17D|nr:hypothetical protein [Campylobacter sp. RM12651]ULO03764.1 hypothetical protein AVBRAN_1310 [Campylobacter sp. RM12651]